MLEALRSRGPDDCGVWRETDGRVVLGHTRLSIIDVSGSKQPMTNEDGTIVVTYNGEIYNFADLRHFLARRGHTLRTRGDTEVLPHLYEEYGIGMLGLLDGMFAFALYDRRTRRLLLARDRVGVKPLYYWHDSTLGALVFASDTGALLSSGVPPRRLDPRALAQYLHFGHVVHPQGWLQGVRQVEPGEVVELHDGRLRHARYHEWRYEPRVELHDRALAVGELGAHLADSVQSQMIADVPLGTFLSGGLDSGTVTGFAQYVRARSGGAVQSYTVRFGLPDYDESRRARDTARDLNTCHTEIAGDEVRFDRQFLDRFVTALGEPFGDTSALAVYGLCLEARPHIKVALSGDGGDELFLGYTGMWRQHWARRFRIVPRVARRVSRALGRGRSSAVVRKLHRYAHLSLLDDAGLIIDYSRRWEWGGLGTVLGGDLFEQLFPDADQPFPEVRAIIGDGSRGGFLEQQSRFHLLVTLPCDGLQKIDRMSMAHGLEVRVPMLSNGMLSYAAQLPLSMRRRGRRTKEPLRTVAEGVAPSLARRSPKRGLQFPLDIWVRSALPEHWRTWEITPRLGEIGFGRLEVDRVVEQYRAVAPGESNDRTRSLAHRLFDLLLLALWVEKHHIRL